MIFFLSKLDRSVLNRPFQQSQLACVSPLPTPLFQFVFQACALSRPLPPPLLPLPNLLLPFFGRYVVNTLQMAGGPCSDQASPSLVPRFHFASTYDMSTSFFRLPMSTFYVFICFFFHLGHLQLKLDSRRSLPRQVKVKTALRLSDGGVSAVFRRAKSDLLAGFSRGTCRCPLVGRRIFPRSVISGARRSPEQRLSKGAGFPVERSRCACLLAAARLCIIAARLYIWSSNQEHTRTFLWVRPESIAVRGSILPKF